MDIISSLPDDILCHILSFLPTKSAVACSFLSTRWRHLWAYVPVLDFDARLYGGPSPITSINASRQSEMIFRNFVSRVLLFNVMPYIRKFRLIYECHCRPVPIRTWFLVAISSHIQELEVDLCFSVRGDLVDLPRMLFTSSMLVTLKLSRMPLNVPSYVCFPSLKVLELRRIMYLHDNCIENLLSGCQTLEELVIEETAREKQKVVLINIHTLRSFWFGYRFVIDLMGDLPYKFIINAPNLEYFHVKGLISDVFEVRSLASLNNAYVDLRQTPISTQSYLSCYHRIFDLMEGLTNAKSITLSGAAVQLLCESSNRALPRFSNLKQLAFGIDFDFCWKKILAEFIRCSCNLEAVSLNNKQGFLRDMEELREMPIQPLPVNMLSYLKNILIDELYANFMPEYVEYMVQHVHVLKRLKINCHCPIMLRSQIGLPS